MANQLAIKLDARALLLVTDVPGVMRDIKDPASRIPRITIAEGKKAIEDGVVTKGMIPKLEESFAALKEGVRAVHIVGRLKRGDLSREVAEPGSVGTVLVAVDRADRDRRRRARKPAERGARARAGRRGRREPRG